MMMMIMRALKTTCFDLSRSSSGFSVTNEIRFCDQYLDGECYPLVCINIAC